MLATGRKRNPRTPRFHKHRSRNPWKAEDFVAAPTQSFAPETGLTSLFPLTFELWSTVPVLVLCMVQVGLSVCPGMAQLIFHHTEAIIPRYYPVLYCTVQYIVRVIM